MPPVPTSVIARTTGAVETSLETSHQDASRIRLKNSNSRNKNSHSHHNSDSNSTSHNNSNNNNHNKQKTTHAPSNFFIPKFKPLYGDIEDIQRRHPDVGFVAQDAFSGQWWQATKQFLQYQAVDNVYESTAEGASFEVFNRNEHQMRITRDWMDYNVEHLSKWWKLMLDPYHRRRSNSQLYLKRVCEILHTYITSPQREVFWQQLLRSTTQQQQDTNTNSTSIDNGNNNDDNEDESYFAVAQGTIAVVAYMPFHVTQTSATMDGDRQDSHTLTKLSLAATLLSLVQIGVGRIIVSGELVEGNKDDADDLATIAAAFDLVAQITQHWSPPPLPNRQNRPHEANETSRTITTLNYCVAEDATTSHLQHNIPKAALKQLRKVFLMEETRNTTIATTDEMSLKQEELQKIHHCWLGAPDEENDEDDPWWETPLSLSSQARWPYVLLTEPDLIVNTRPDALPLLGRALRQGGVLAPHRLQPIPHASDFPLPWMEEDRGEGVGTDLTSTTTTNTAIITRRTQTEDTEDRIHRHSNNADAVDLSTMDYWDTIPNVPPFDRIIDIEHYEAVDSRGVAISRSSSTSAAAAAVASACCDAGNAYPYAKKTLTYTDACGIFWWMCGYNTLRERTNFVPCTTADHRHHNTTETLEGKQRSQQPQPPQSPQHRCDKQGGTVASIQKIAEVHKRIAQYPLMRLTQGTGVVFLGSESGRMCQPTPTIGSCKATPPLIGTTAATAPSAKSATAPFKSTTTTSTTPPQTRSIPPWRTAARIVEHK